MCVCVCLGPMIAAVICSLLPATVITVVDMVLRALQTQATRLRLDARQWVYVCGGVSVIFVTPLCVHMCVCAQSFAPRVCN